MQSRRALGTLALISLVTAAVSFAIVDMATTAAKTCAGAAETAGPACAHDAVPVLAVTFTIVGFLAVAVGLVPGIGWVRASLAAARGAEDDELADDDGDDELADDV